MFTSGSRRIYDTYIPYPYNFLETKRLSIFMPIEEIKVSINSIVNDIANVVKFFHFYKFFQSFFFRIQ